MEQVLGALIVVLLDLVRHRTRVVPVLLVVVVVPAVAARWVLLPVLLLGGLEARDAQRLLDRLRIK